MIIINVKNEPVKTLKETYYQAADCWRGTCDLCQSTYHQHGNYLRKTPLPLGPIFIKRVYCKNCKISHALLPCFIIPYSRVTDVVKESAITDIYRGHQTIEQLAELFSLDPTTIARWWKIFCDRAKVMLEALAGKLTQSSRLTDWLSGPLESPYERVGKVLELMERCKTIFSTSFKFGRFAWVNLFNPYLLLKG